LFYELIHNGKKVENLWSKATSCLDCSTGHINKTCKERFTGYYLFLATVHLLHHNKCSCKHSAEKGVACGTTTECQVHSNDNSVYPNVQTLILLILTIICTTASVKYSVEIVKLILA